MRPCCTVAIHPEVPKLSEFLPSYAASFFPSRSLSYFFSPILIMWARFSVLLLFLRYKPIIANRTCYWPDGSKIADSFDYAPCDLTAIGVASACCASTDPCSPNGYCFGTAGYTYRGGCTDINWDADKCCPSCRNGIESIIPSCLPSRP